MSSSSNEGQRRRRDERATNPPPMRETDNDRRIVQLVYDYRLLSQEQIQRLLNRSKPTVQRLLRRLYDHRYLDRVFLPIAAFGSSPALYILDRQGIEALQRMGIEDFTALPKKNLSGMFLEHTLAMNEFRIRLTLACQTRGWQIERWYTENEIKADYDRVRVPGKAHAVAVVPDSFFSIAVPEKGITHFFLELDRGKMDLKTFQQKIKAYVAYHRSGAYQQRYDAKGFRVLTVVDGIGRGRVTNLAQITGEVSGIGRRFWFVNLADVTRANILTDPIWQVAGSTDPVALFRA